MTRQIGDEDVRQIRLTPALARAMLEQNTHNRALRPGRVAELAAAIRRGEWDLNGETIKRAFDGTILDGQHRLAAVVMAGISIEVFLVDGLAPEAQDSVDTGRKRRLSDILAIHGIRDARAVSSAVTQLHRTRCAGTVDSFDWPSPTPQQALALLREEPAIEESARQARAITVEIGGSFGVFAVLHHLFGKIDRVAADGFFEGLKSGASLSRRDPLLVLRNTLVRPRADRYFKHSPRHVAAMTIHAFNLRRQRRRVSSIRIDWRSGFPRILLPEELA